MSTRHDISNRPEGIFGLVLQEAAVGDEVIYHVGPHASGPHKREAFSTYTEGKCILYQRKLGAGNFEYIAKKKGKK
ncbi:hypothetical protein UFOVP1202_36 [uncultured Caudovirales phage]|uniref:Uncharacterized protein n=1 Tax=uncultured Caudovirales phage TaxID=2100421 RepID=A0A6J5R9Q1_9CAUD|nr:hypothetical protein UFOVP1202_36 [uncultured Caudovirales phage]